MPKPLGFINHNPERVILTPSGLRTTHAGHKLLAGFTAILTLAAERYLGEESDPVITRADASRSRFRMDPRRSETSSSPTPARTRMSSRARSPRSCYEGDTAFGSMSLS
jgi:hypothetical protein